MNTLSYLSSIFLPTPRSVTVQDDNNHLESTSSSSAQPITTTTTTTSTTTSIDTDEENSEPVASTSTLPSSSTLSDLLESSSGGGDTIYLTARRRPPRRNNSRLSGGDETEISNNGNDNGREGLGRNDEEVEDGDESPIISISTTPPSHLIGILNERQAVDEGGGGGGGLIRRTSLKVKNTQATTTSIDEDNGGEDKTVIVEDDGIREQEVLPGKEVSSDQVGDELKNGSSMTEAEELLQAEKLHALKEKEYQQRLLSTQQPSSTSWSLIPTSIPIPGLTTLWMILKGVLNFLRIPYTHSSRSKRNTLLAGTGTDFNSVMTEKAIPTNDPNDGNDELITSLEKSATPSSNSTTSRPSFFFNRKNSTPSSSQLPSRSSTPIPTSNSTSTSSTTKPIPSLPPRLTPKTLVLDLDETLIHSTSRPYASTSKRSQGLKVRVVEVILDGRSTVYTVYKRPWVDYFLRKVSSWYTVIIFTASLPEYADPVIDWLDGGDGGGGMVGGRLFRSDCLHSNGAYVKDLSVVDSDLSRVCLVDNSPVSYAINQANGIPIEGWINDPNDECLLDLLPMLDSLRFTNDVRRVLGLRGFGK